MHSGLIYALEANMHSGRDPMLKTMGLVDLENLSTDQDSR